jgi:hypothetical protein
MFVRSLHCAWGRGKVEMVMKMVTWKMDSGEPVVEHTDTGVTELREEENGMAVFGSSNGRRQWPAWKEGRTAVVSVKGEHDGAVRPTQWRRTAAFYRQEMSACGF